MPNILALDTSTEACSAAILSAGRTVERFAELPRGHAAHILGMVQDVLAEAELAITDLDAVTFCRGPGAFTGVRIACGVVQGIAFGGNLPVVPLSTLAVLAQGALRELEAEHVVAAIDARMGEVYTGEYRAENGLMRLCGQEQVAAPEALQAVQETGWHGVGTGWTAYPEALAAHLGQPQSMTGSLPRALDCLPLAAAAVARGETMGAEAALPVYLRDKVTS